MTSPIALHRAKNVPCAVLVSEDCLHFVVCACLPLGLGCGEEALRIGGGGKDRGGLLQQVWFPCGTAVQGSESASLQLGGTGRVVDLMFAGEYHPDA